MQRRLKAALTSIAPKLESGGHRPAQGTPPVDQGPEPGDSWRGPGSETGKNHKLRTNIDRVASWGHMPIFRKRVRFSRPGERKPSTPHGLGCEEGENVWQ